MASGELSQRRNYPLRERIARTSPSTRAWLLFGGLLILAAAFLLYETRGTTLWFDEWNYALYRRGHSLATFLDPQNQHFSLVPIVLYKVLFATVGIDHYGPYRVIVIAGHLACSTLLFIYASRRVGSYFALLAAGLFLLFGPAWQTSIWPIQIAWVIPVGAGVGALLMLDRGDRLGDVVACVLAGLALASSSIGVPIVLGLVVNVLGAPTRRKKAWIVLIPLVLFAIWWLAYQTSDFNRHNIVLTPLFVAKAAGGAVGALFGLEGEAVFQDASTPLIWGAPLLVAALVAGALRLVRLGAVSLRLASLLTMALSFWTLTGLTRAAVAFGYESRYLYVSAMLILLITVELAQRVTVPMAAKVVIGVVVAGATLSNVGAFRDGGRFLQDQGRQTKADLAVLDLVRPVVAPGYVAQRLPGYPYVRARAGAYYSAEKAYGTPALSPADLPSQPEFVRSAVDAEFSSAHGVGLTSAPPGASLGSPPATDAASGGAVRNGGSCANFTPAGFGSTSSTSTFDFTLPASGVLLKTRGGPATLSVRRYADEFPAAPQARMGSSATAVLRIRPDLSRQPWHVRVAPSARLTVCGLA